MLEALERVLSGVAGLRVAYVFGSRARGDGRPDSDVDVAVLEDGALGPWALGALAESLERACGARVDVVDLASASPTLAMEIVRDGKLLHARTRAEDLEFRLKAVRTWQDTAHLRRVQRRYLREWSERRRGGRAS